VQLAQNVFRGSESLQKFTSGSCPPVRFRLHFTSSARSIEFAFSALMLSVGRQEGHLACKKQDGGGGHWLGWMEWRPAGRSVCLLLLVFPCTTKSRSSLLAPAQLGGPGKRATKWLWWVVVVLTPPNACASSKLKLICFKNSTQI